MLAPGHRLPPADLGGLLSRHALPAGPDLTASSASRADGWLAAGAATGLTAIPCTSPRYPRLVLELSDAPPVLWSSGVAEVLAQPAIAIVGARECSVSATRLATELARELAAAGLVVISGLARGVDAAAHRGALQAGRTVAVLGSGADIVYPAEHRGLASEVRERGALVSEFPPGTRPKAWHFPRRNRIIAGLAAGVIVVEAGQTSGALITTREALDQGKEVMVVPGSVAAGRNRGGHALLKDGATLVEDASDVLEVLQGSPLLALAGLRTGVGPRTSCHAPDQGQPTLPARWAIGDELDLDELNELMDLPVHAIPRRLVEWELAGHIARTPLGRFVRLCR